MDKFLRNVENKLRGPVKGRPEVLEELRGHLQDRITALVEQSYAPEVAEAQAIREMGPAWLLALRLSWANGWNLFPEILRELGALGFSLVMMLLAAPQLFFISRITDPNILPANPWAAAAAVVGAGYLITLVALAAFAFYLTRLRRSRIWAILPAYLMFINFPDYYYLVGVIFVIAVALGAIKPSPHPVWPLWAAAGMALLTGLGVILKVEMAAAHLPLSQKMLADYLYGSAISTAEFWGFLGAGGFLWLGAWILERVHTPLITQAPE